VTGAMKGTPGHVPNRHLELPRLIVRLADAVSNPQRQPALVLVLRIGRCVLLEQLVRLRVELRAVSVSLGHSNLYAHTSRIMTRWSTFFSFVNPGDGLTGDFWLSCYADQPQ
jgi:hypothetical protein